MKDTSAPSLAITGASVILPEEIVETDVVIADGVIQSIGREEAADNTLDARGLILAPAIIDVHGDAFERQIMPRAGVFAPLDIALLDTDRQLAANGIATAYHALTLSWEPGLRSVDRAAEVIRGLTALAPRFMVENRIQLRWETFAFEALDLIEEALAGPLLPSIAFNDHTSMTMRAFDVAIQDREFELSPDFTIAALDDARMVQRTTKKAERANMSDDEYRALLGQIWGRRGEVDATISKVAGMGRKAGAPMLSHDDTRTETREYYRALGVDVAEFPMVTEAATAAKDADEPIIFGAPNAMRGGSHIGSLAAADMVEAGMCDALASDYFYPSLLGAIARLDAERRAERPALWSLVSSGPARAMRLNDRGSISPDKRADLTLLDWPDGATPAVRQTIVAGRTAFAGTPLGAVG
ncbi:alpha-D-ribose 1-methylphosphonate 5-triphosphate diphosphatase [Aestuariibius sp. 2305UL40-4]|uniref:alpha-D-ribose 1-methylphosphonate 5-triphosphate diphosphatase n=1 Tax=Aestuariibius violaceus TaxID=3234132 RepID=UPI00345E43FF